MTSGSPEAFLKRLKSTNSIPLALSAWKDKDFYLPSKGQHIAAWALDHLLKTPVAVHNVLIWRLLDDIILGTTGSYSQWLSSVLYKTPTVPILASLLRPAPDEKPRKDAKELAEVSRRVMEVILPMAFPRTRFETVLDCLWAAFASVSHPRAPKEMSYHQMVALRGFQAAFANATNKGKVYSNFIQNHFVSWLQALHTSQSDVELEKELWQSGRDILTSLDALKSLHNPETKPQENYFEHLKAAATSTPIVLQVAPRIFRDQAAATKVHRIQLANMKLDTSTSRLFSSYVAVYVDCAEDQQPQALLDHMRVIEATPDISIRDQEWKAILMRIRDVVFTRLVSQLDSSNKAKYLEILAIIGRIDYNLLLPHIILLLRLMASYHGPTQPCTDLFQVLIDYHSRTRTLDQLCQAILEAAISMQEASLNMETRDTEGQGVDILNGPLYGIQGGKALCKAVNLTLTPGQVPTFTDYCVSKMCESLSSLKTILDAKIPDDHTVRSAALTATYICRASSFILPHLPSSNLSWTRLDMDIIGRRLQDEFILSGLQICLQSGSSATWGCQILGASILHLVSLLNQMDSWPTLQIPYARVIPYMEGSIVFSNAGVIPDLQLEAARILCRASSLEIAQSAFQHILDNMDCASNASWNGRTAGMSSESLSCAYWHLLSIQELQNLAVHATDQQLKQFSNLLFLCYDPSITSSQCSAITPASCIHRLLKSAQFWECSRIHEQLFSIVLPKTAQVNIQKPSTINLSSDSLLSISRSFGILLGFPFEVIKPHINILAQRAILADIAISNLEPSSIRTLTYMRTILRTFVSRRMRDHQTAFREFMSTWAVVDSLYLSCQITSIQDEAFSQSTTQLLDLAYRSLLNAKRAPRDDITRTGKMISLQSRSIDALSSLHLECLAIILFAVGDYLKNSELDESVVREARTMASPIASRLRTNLPRYSSGVKALRSCLYVQRMTNDWSQSEQGHLPLYQNLYNAIFKSKLESLDAEETFAQFLWAVVDSLEGVSQFSEYHEVFLAGYSLAAQKADNWSPIDQPLHKLSRSLTPDTYEKFIELVQNSFITALKPAQPTLLHALMVTFRAAPEGTYRILRATASRSIQHVSSIKIFQWDETSMRLNQELLSYILYICLEKPILLGHASIGSLLVIISSLVHGSEYKCLKTSIETFDKIVSITSALIRNRRDLLLSALPHLAIVLAHTMKQFASVQPNLGQRQRQAVSNKLAPWVTLDQPLGPTEAAAFSRLLVSLKTKTVTRTKFQVPTGLNDTNPESQSLAKPFGKHASSVLLAYLDLVTDQLCVISRSVRAELAPGLYVLCELTGERGRDALMAGLDQEKSVMLKSLWSAYEKQKYIGQG
ncbi:hypothetical protein PIIN_04096 [Serendipita indica DSM 11827]|uniref:Nucleolar 27S pre-rRNA processing Urb2/Npa2 C-terminal domain-containing protein n=1 Tax=Serendipita indica (strain DSM 11827) TaxID=1109443 RepID=G4TFS3_SERID|nr:hypothetical protein PIIN_04096 [Serendipita indica DSM 11827]